MKKILSLLLAISALAGCSESDNLKGQFISSCIQSGITKPICNCIHDHISNTFTKEERFKLFTDYEYLNQLQKVTLQAQQYCLSN